MLHLAIHALAARVGRGAVCPVGWCAANVTEIESEFRW